VQVFPFGNFLNVFDFPTALQVLFALNIIDREILLVCFIPVAEKIGFEAFIFLDNILLLGSFKLLANLINGFDVVRSTDLVEEIHVV